LKKKNLILNYHRILSADDFRSDDLNGIYEINLSDFEWQMDFLLQNKIPIVSTRQLKNPETLPESSVCISFDDGNFSDYELVLPILKQRQIHATFFIPVNKGELNWVELNEMVEHGFEIGSHGMNHIVMGVTADDEMNTSKRVLEECLSADISSFAFPFGIYSRRSMEMAKACGYEILFSTDKKVNFPEDRPVLFHRWTITKATTKNNFDKLITSNVYRKRKSIIFHFVKIGKRLVGKRMADRLNLHLNS
jgi:peptidoglycan/xylan/chitin deacetylase (PgdA/CDA1 family)